jgi:hypothetical protein
VVNFEQLEWHRSGENEACHMSKGQKSHVLADPREKTARTAESSLGLAKDLGGRNKAVLACHFTHNVHFSVSVKHSI